MKSSILRAGVVALACALGLSACGGGSGDLYLTGSVLNVTKDGLVLTDVKFERLPPGASRDRCPSGCDRVVVALTSVPAYALTTAPNGRPRHLQGHGDRAQKSRTDAPPRRRLSP